MNLLKSLPVQLVIAIGVAYALGDVMSVSWIRMAFTLSCILKDILMAALPFVIFSYLAAAIVRLDRRGPLLVLGIIILVCLSNALGVLTSFTVAHWVLPSLSLGETLSAVPLDIQPIIPLFTLPIPQLMSPSIAMILGFVYGFTTSYFQSARYILLAERMRDGVTHGLKKGFIPLLPIYVFGFVLKLQYEGVLELLCVQYGPILLTELVLFTAYVGVLYLVASGFRLSRCFELIRNMLPATLTGFSTMSSAATMPVTLAGCEKNLPTPHYAQLFVPTTVNIHTIGDSLGIPLLALSVLVFSGHDLPTFAQFLPFVLFFCVTKFSTAAIPGGGILVLLPIFESSLGLSPAMVGLVTTLYILQDGLTTAASVLGNGAFCVLTRRILRQIGLLKEQETTAHTAPEPSEAAHVQPVSAANSAIISDTEPVSVCTETAH